jgi:quercetin dioxygenase-like cupin family protein
MFKIFSQATKVQECDVEIGANLTRIRELTEKLDFSQIIDRRNNGESIEYALEQGKAMSFGLWKTQEIAVARTVMSEGAKWQKHSHDEKEIVIVYRGSIKIIHDDHEVLLVEGDTYTIEPGNRHEAISANGCDVIAITIPAADDWPAGG